MDDGTVEAVSDCRAGRAAADVVGSEHEVVDQQLRASSEQVGERRGALIGIEAVILLDANPRELLSLLGHFVAATGQLLLGYEQVHPGRKPLVTRSGLMTGHSFSPSHRWHESGY